MNALSSAIFALAALSAGVLSAQQTAGGFHAVACIKVEPNKRAEFTQFTRDVATKWMQARADSGEIAAAFLLRPVLPSGSEQRCDYVSVTVFPGAPPEPAGLDHLTAMLRKAGVGMSGEEFAARRNSVSHLVSSELWRTAISIGHVEKGDYAYANFMKVHDVPAYMELEQSLWKPMAQAWIEQGSLHGWVVNRPVLPGGTDLKYQAVTLDIYPSWSEAMKPRPIEETFKKVHGDKDLKQSFERLGKSRDLGRRELLVVEEKIVPSR
jgi:hypothetical protein